MGKMPWAAAVRALEYANNYSYRYFKLTNPPAENEAKNRYNEVQEGIKAKVKSITSFVPEDSKMIDLYKSIVGELDQKIDDSIKEEMWLFKKIYGLSIDGYVGKRNTDESFTLKTDVYKNLIKACSENGPTSLGSIENNPIEIWTKLSLGISLKDEDQDALYIQDPNGFAFSIILGSKEIYEALAAKSDYDNKIYNAGLLSRRKAIEKRNLFNSKNFFNPDGKKANLLTLRLLQEDLKQKTTQIKIFNKTEDERKKIIDIANKVIKQNIEYYTGKMLPENPKFAKNQNYKKDFETLGEIDVLASTLSEKIRLEIVKAVKDEIKDIQFTIDVSNPETGSSYFIVSTEYSVNKFVENLRNTDIDKKLAKTDLNGLNVDKDTVKQTRLKIIQVFFDTLTEAIKSLENKNTLEISGLSLNKEVSLQKIIEKVYIRQGRNSKQKAFKTLKGFYSAAISFYNKEGKVMLNKLSNSKSKTLNGKAWEIFDPYKINTYVSGVLGELRGNYGFGQILKQTTTLSGNTSFEFGQSINDVFGRIQVGTDKNGRSIMQKIGMQVKNYVASENSITLYEGGNKMSIFNKKMNKYLSAEDDVILRFLSANLGFIADGLDEKKILEYIGRMISYSHIENFYRISSFSRKEGDNLFFSINNVIYPSSYIYACMKYSINQSIKNTNAKGLLLQVTSNVKTTKPTTFANYNMAASKWKQENYNLRQMNTTPNGNNIYVKTRGMHFNLIKLNLF